MQTVTIEKKQARPTIGVLMGWETYAWTLDGFARTVFDGIQAAARALDCNLLFSCGVNYLAAPIDRMCPAWPVISPDTNFVPVGPWNTEGLIVITPLVTPERSEYIQQIGAAGHPLVFIGPGEGSPALIPDNVGGVREAMMHLVEHGHRRIAFVGER